MAIIIAIGVVVVFRNTGIFLQEAIVFDEYKWNWDPDATSPTVQCV